MKRHDRANSDCKYERKYGGEESHMPTVPYDEIKRKIAMNSPARIRDAANIENQ